MPWRSRALVVFLFAFAAPAASAAETYAGAPPRVTLTGGGRAATGKALTFAASTSAKLGRFALELRAVDLRRTPRSAFSQPDYRHPRRCTTLPCRWTVTKSVGSTYEFRAAVVDAKTGAAIALSDAVRAAWGPRAASTPRPRAFKLFVNGKRYALSPIVGGADTYLDVDAGKINVVARWRTDARASGYRVVIATSEPEVRFYASCARGTSCRVTKPVRILKDQEVSWTVKLVRIRGNDVVVGLKACLIGRA